MYFVFVTQTKWILKWIEKLRRLSLNSFFFSKIWPEDIPVYKVFPRRHWLWSSRTQFQNLLALNIVDFSHKQKIRNIYIYNIMLLMMRWWWDDVCIFRIYNFSCFILEFYLIVFFGFLFQRDKYKTKALMVNLSCLRSTDILFYSVIVQELRVWWKMKPLEWIII